MKTHTISVDNIKCGGCATTISRLVKKAGGHAPIVIDTATGSITYDLPEPATPGSSTEALERAHEAIQAALSKAGYPPSGESGLTDKALSYISCMKGRISDVVDGPDESTSASG